MSSLSDATYQKAIEVLRRNATQRGLKASHAYSKANGILRVGEDVGFNEWLDGRKGEARGQYGQSWNAWMYMAAYASVHGKHPFAFLR